MGTSPPVTGSQAVDRAALLLAEIVRSPGPRTFSSLVADLGLAKSTVSRLLQALERGRLVQRDRTGSFRPGALLAVYAARDTTVQDLVEIIRPALDRLAAATGETVNFAVPRGDGVVQVAQIDGRYLLGATNWVGVRVPAHCSALGKVFYAEGLLPLPDGPLERRTPATVASRQELDQQLAEVRRCGYAVTWEELEPGLVALAAPVRSAGGAPLGAVSVSGPTTRLPRESLPGVAGHLLAAADEVRALLRDDHRPPAGREGAA